MTGNRETGFWETGERRRKVRVIQTLPVSVSGVDASGKAFQAHTLLDNLSACGLYMQLPRRVDPGSHLEIHIQYSDQLPTARIAASGVVRRTEERAHGLYGIGVEFTKYEFTPPATGEGGENSAGTPPGDA